MSGSALSRARTVGSAEDDPASTAAKPSSQRVSVVVLGDVGHSPRMTYHSLSLANEGYHVSLFGYCNSKPQQELLSHPNITVVPLRQVPKCIGTLPKLLRFVFRVLWQALTLWFSLLTSKRPNCLILQNPPGVPALPVCWLYCILCRARLFVDWHNYGFTILALGLGKRHLLVHIYKVIEKCFGRLASAGFCVSEAMKYDLSNNWRIDNVTVHYDRPPAHFQPMSIESRHDLFLKLTSQLPCLAGSAPDKTVFTERFADGRVCYFEDRPALLVSSTSWTEDEDFSILLRALSEYDSHARLATSEYPRLIVVVTGKGPLKDYYLSEARRCCWECVQLETVWLDAADYPRFLAVADVGVSLHVSSSGVDLPMKVVDMFGCGLPVLAKEYPTLQELVQHDYNGLMFRTDDELADRLMSWFKGFPLSRRHRERRDKFKQNIATFCQLRWHECWKKNVLPVIRGRENINATTDC